MKTKIIYISGNELFDMADIRAAFDEVRNALSLDNDTILFGVPVDNDDALSEKTTIEEKSTPFIKPVVEQTAEPIIEETTEEIEPIIEIVEEPKLKKAKVVPISEHIKPSSEQTTEQEPSVVPILSVLGTNAPETADETNEDNVIDDIEIETAEPIVEEPVDTIEENVTTEEVSISDIISDEVPTIEHEKTLEELLESMTPLGEDTTPSYEEPAATVDIENEPKSVIENSTDDDTDITLEKLANEFVANQDKFETPTKPATRSKIGKLKNILPFKKAKHDDSGLMGDLFGWAGVAANDEDFTIPGFFTNAASKK